MHFFDEIWDIINESEKEIKFLKFDDFYAKFKTTKEQNFTRDSKAKPLARPCYEKFCKVIAMKDINKKIPSHQKQLNFLHNVAHIEFSAIDIALDAVYRFENLPYDYYADWLEVAQDEIRHFKMIEKLLGEYGAKYGDFEVHDGLFVALCKTQDSLKKRMALLPRYMEANGLDANTHIIKKLSQEAGNEKILEALNVILAEEVSHVSKGDRWFRYACELEGASTDEYINIVRELYPNAFASARELNEEARLKAGFSVAELEAIKSVARGRNG
ncbi:ferritin-like domain-containing protein [Campylobacter suis]|uniref:Ferritin-like domain-containing protein n=1 Tax=Campylobacter suis TaxID=2790657 RepID=A0ABN7K3J6_9BACT|nr:ferritin-like domain-containing protein [Campylobacter suis]CAD7287045.1 hypothetical protein LMG8286_00675 [Campylobacter suis]